MVPPRIVRTSPESEIFASPESEIFAANGPPDAPRETPRIRPTLFAGVGLLAVVACLAGAFIGSTTAQEPPTELPQKIPAAPTTLPMGQIRLPDIGDLPLPEQPPADPATQAKIADALRGQDVDAGGDEMLDDVLQIIRRRGSVLDGSSLDENNPLDDASGDASSDASSDASGDASGVPWVRPAGMNPAGPSAAACQTAESLLRSARLLDRSLPGDPLVTQLRQKAVQVLLTGG